MHTSAPTLTASEKPYASERGKWLASQLCDRFHQCQNCHPERERERDSLALILFPPVGQATSRRLKVVRHWRRSSNAAGSELFTWLYFSRWFRINGFGSVGERASEQKAAYKKQPPGRRRKDRVASKWWSSGAEWRRSRRL